MSREAGEATAPAGLALNRDRDNEAWLASFLRPRPGGPAERLADRFYGRPVLAFAVALVVAFLVAAALSIALGLLVTDVVIRTGGIGSADEDFVESIVDGRTSFLTDGSVVGSTVGSTVLVALAVLVALYFAYRRRWLLAAFAAFLPAVESGLYRVTSLADPRHRPSVHRLEDLPADASYPSGHTGASIAVYAGLALLLTSQIRSRSVRQLVWAAVLLIVVFVAMSRIYRGMHHPLDCAGGALIGIAAIVVVVFACRTAVAADPSAAEATR